MRIHIQNLPEPNTFDITEAQWREAGGSGHTLSFGRTAADFAAAALEAEAIILPGSQMRGFLPLHAPKLRILSITSAGVDKLLPLDWLPPGVMLLNNSGTHRAKMEQYAAMALVMLATRMPSFIRAQQEQRWTPIFTPTLAGRSLLVIGTGDLGAATARQARHFGMRTTGIRTSATPHPDFDTILPATELDAALPHAEFLALACPLTPATTGLMSAARLAGLPPSACLLNVGRGALLDQDALCDLLDSGHLAGAIIDVTTPEPPPPGHRLWTTPNLVITPHVSADSPTTYNADTLRIFLANLRAEAEGRPMPNRVDPARGY